MTVDNEISVPTLDPERTLELVLEAVSELVEYELAVVLGLDPDHTLRVRKAAGPLKTDSLSGFTISLDERNDIARILSEGKPRLFAADEEHIDTYDEILDLPAGHSCMVAPLKVDGRPIGLLTLDHRSCNMFTPGIVRFIATISRLISLSLAKSDQAEILARANQDLVRERNGLLTPGYAPLAGMLGSSPASLRALESIRLVAGSDLPVLILGETGTGKELAARSVHRLSGRSDGPFVAVNCSAMAPSLAESELFGHEKGSFTGAQSLRKGRFELADGGTLFLDEIGDLPLELQPKLLRALQEGTIDRIGGERPVRIDARIVAATHVNLETAVRNGRFREDLYYRLSVFPVSLPPLRERDGDIVLIAESFVEGMRKRPGMEALALGTEAITELERRTWPGNVRELRNAIERAAILARGGIIQGGHLAVPGKTDNHIQPAGTTLSKEEAELPGTTAVRPRTEIQSSGMASLQSGLPPPGTASAQAGTGSGPAISLTDARRAATMEAITTALTRSGGKIYGPGGAAELLDMKPTTLQSTMKRLGIARCGPRGA